MMKKTCGALAAALFLGLVSCSDENPWIETEAGHGVIKLSLSADGSVKDAMPTRADSYFDTPTADDFYVHLYKDGSDTPHTNLTHSEFVAKESFPTGSYLLKAFSGSLEEEGFGVRPYFEGTTHIVVLENHETKAVVEARLGHTLVSVDYTEAFLDYMQTYDVKLNSEGHSYVDVPAGESRPAFLVPGDVSLWLDFTDRQGRQLKLCPASFNAEAAHHYTVRLNVNQGEVGYATLQISFLKDLEEETVSIDLTEELYAAQPPEVRPVNFTDGEELDFITGDTSDQPLRFNVLSYGGLKNLKLTFNVLDGGYKPAFGNSVDLIGADESVQAQLKAAGIDCKGVFRNPDKMAFIDVTNVSRVLPAGEYEISVMATDVMTRASDPVSIVINSIDPTVKAEPLKANPSTHEGTLKITYNGNSTSDITFKAANADGMMVDAPVILVTDFSTRSKIEDKEFLYTIRLPEFGDRVEEEVEVYLHGKRVLREVMLPVSTSFHADAFARRVMIKALAQKSKIAGIMSNARVEIASDGASVSVTEDGRDSSTGIFTFSGLQPATTYTYTVTDYDGSEVYTGEFTTETENQLTNNDFSSMAETINIDRINAGGIYTYNFVLSGTYRNKTSIVVETPQGWGNINDITCDFEGSLNPNTWYVVPSTIGNSANNTVAVRTVGYSHNGPELPYWTATINNFYSQNAPDRSAFDVAAGQLYYGDSAARGGAFSTRPSGVSFGYSYAPVNGETAMVEVKVLSGSEVIGIGKTVFGTGSEGNVAIAYDKNAFGKKATGLSLVFYSSSAASPEINIPKGTDLKDNPKQSAPDADLSDRNNPDKSGSILNTNTYKSFAAGSVLTIDNVKLNY